MSETVASLAIDPIQAPTGRRQSARGGTSAIQTRSMIVQIVGRTSLEFRKLLQSHLCLRGNGYAEKIRPGGRLELIPIHPDTCTPKMSDSGVITYEVQTQEQRRTLPQNKILHLRGIGSNGLVGLSPIEICRDAIGAGMAVQQYGSRFFMNNARPSGIIEYPGVMQDKEEIAAFKKSWQEAQTGANQHKTAVLERGMTYKPIGISNEDSQFLETRKFSVEEIARIYRIPMHLLQSLDKSSFNNISHQSMEFLTYTMIPWFRRWESVLARDLLTAEERTEYFFEFLVDGFLRGDIQTRYNAYTKGRQWGWLSPNDVRRMENMNPIDGGDEYLTPLNMQAIGQQDNGADNADKN